MGDPVLFLGREDPLKGMIICYSILAWRILRPEEPSRLQSTGPHRVRHNWATHTHTHTHIIIIFIITVIFIAYYILLSVTRLFATMLPSVLCSRIGWLSVYALKEIIVIFMETDSDTSLLFFGFPHGSVVKNLPADAGDTGWCGVQSLGWEDPWEEGMATYSSIHAWKIPSPAGSGGIQSIGLPKSWTWLSNWAHLLFNFYATGLCY